MAAAHRSFAEYVKKKFDNNFWAAAESYLEANLDSLGIELRRIHRAGETEISDVKVEHVWVEDKPGMEVHFDVAISIWFETHEGDYHYDDYDENIVWMMAHCRGDLDKNLDDFEILRVSKYNGKSRVKDPMDDSLVPIIPYEKLDDVATVFLQEYYPAALRIPMRGQDPVWVDPTELAKNMGLTVKNQRIREDGSVFGQIYFDDTDTVMYDANEDADAPTHIKGKTIVVDPQIYLLRNLGSFNNTIVHECVHWAKHRKAFKLEQLFNTDASYISCEVVGDADSRISIKSTKYMEKQANQLAPRIQMPKEPFTIKAKEYIAYYMRQTEARHTVDVMEMVIGALERDYGVSRQAALNGAGRDGGTEGKSPDAVGRIDEQHPQPSGGSHLDGTDLQLSIANEEEVSANLPTVEQQIEKITQAEDEKSSAFVVSQEDIDSVLQMGSSYDKSKYRIYRQLQKNSDSKTNIEFLKKEYGTGGGTHIFPDGTQGGRWADSKGIAIEKQGSYTDPDLRLSWSKVEKRLRELIKNDRYLNPKEKDHYADYLEQVSAPQYEIDTQRKLVRQRFIQSKQALSPADKRDSLALRLSDFIRDLDGYEKELF